MPISEESWQIKMLDKHLTNGQNAGRDWGCLMKTKPRPVFQFVEPGWVAWLDEGDRRLVELVVVRGLSIRSAASILGRNAGLLTRRLASLKRRAAHPVVRQLLADANSLDPLTRDFAISFFLRAETMRSISIRTGLPIEGVRDRLQFARGWARGQAARSARERRAALETIEEVA